MCHLVTGLAFILIMLIVRIFVTVVRSPWIDAEPCTCLVLMVHMQGCDCGVLIRIVSGQVVDNEKYSLSVKCTVYQ